MSAVTVNDPICAADLGWPFAPLCGECEGCLRSTCDDTAGRLDATRSAEGRSHRACGGLGDLGALRPGRRARAGARQAFGTAAVAHPRRVRRPGVGPAQALRA